MYARPQPASVTSTEVSNRPFVACVDVHDRRRERRLPFCVGHIDLNDDGAVERGLGYSVRVEQQLVQT